MHDVINKRSLELKEIAEHKFMNSIDKINKNGKILQDTQKKNKYYMNLVQTILKLDKVDEVVTLSKYVVIKLYAHSINIYQKLNILELFLKNLVNQIKKYICLTKSVN